MALLRWRCWTHCMYHSICFPLALFYFSGFIVHYLARITDHFLMLVEIIRWRDLLVNVFMTLTAGALQCSSLWHTRKGFTSFVSPTSLLIMKLLILICMLLTMLTTISMAKTVRTKQFSFLSSFAHWWFLWISAEYINPIWDQIAMLEEAPYDIYFQQHWFDAQTERQSIGNNFTLTSGEVANPDKIWKHSLINGFNLTGKVNKAMSRRAIYKAMLESFFLITASFLQIHLLKRLFDQKQGLSRV